MLGDLLAALDTALQPGHRRVKAAPRGALVTLTEELLPAEFFAGMFEECGLRFSELPWSVAVESRSADGALVRIRADA